MLDVINVSVGQASSDGINERAVASGVEDCETPGSGLASESKRF